MRAEIVPFVLLVDVSVLIGVKELPSSLSISL